MGVNDLTGDDLRCRRAVTEAEASLLSLVGANPAVGEALSKLVHVIAAEAARTPRFAEAIADALSAGPTGPLDAAPATPKADPKPRTRRGRVSPVGWWESGEVSPALVRGVSLPGCGWAIA